MLTYKIDNEIYLSLPRPEIDSTALFKLINDSRNELMPWLPWVLKIKSIADERETLKRNAQSLDTVSSLNLVIWYKNEIVGSISLKNWDKNNKKIEIGYWLGTEFTGKGIIHRSLKGVCDLAFNKFEVHKIKIYVASDNHASNQIPKNAGFYLDAKLRDHALLFGRFHDENLWSLLKHEWRNQ